MAGVVKFNSSQILGNTVQCVDVLKCWCVDERGLPVKVISVNAVVIDADDQTAAVGSDLPHIAS